MSEVEPERIGRPATLPGRQSWSTWPAYDHAVLGLRNFWYPVLWSRQVTDKPVSVRFLGERVMLCRDGGRVFALQDRCAHRGVPLSEGDKLFPGTITCPYHGWTYRLDSGRLCAVLTDGPDSPINGKVTLGSYPVQERLGLVWLFAAEPGRSPVPLDADLPDELLDGDPCVVGRIEPGRKGSWRYAAENGFDEGHAKFLHRNSWWMKFRPLPAWSLTSVVPGPDPRWLVRHQDQVFWEASFPGVGDFANYSFSRSAAKRLLRRVRRPSPRIAALRIPEMVSVRLPYILRVAYPHFIHYEWAVPEDAEHHRYVQLLVSFPPNKMARALFRAHYFGYIRRVFHVRFTGQDAWMVRNMDVPPERLYRPDSSITEWRRLVEEQNRESPAKPPRQARQPKEAADG